MEFFPDDIFREGLHDVLVGTGLHRLNDADHIVFRSAHHDDRLFFSSSSPQSLEELQAVHYWHVPIEENRIEIRIGVTDTESFLSVFRFQNLESERIHDSLAEESNCPGIIDQQEFLHISSRFGAEFSHSRFEDDRERNYHHLERETKHFVLEVFPCIGFQLIKE